MLTRILGLFGLYQPSPPTVCEKSAVITIPQPETYGVMDRTSIKGRAALAAYAEARAKSAPPPPPAYTPKRATLSTIAVKNFSFDDEGDDECDPSPPFQVQALPEDSLMERVSTGAPCITRYRFTEVELLYPEIHVPGLSLKRAQLRRIDNQEETDGPVNGGKFVYLSQMFVDSDKQREEERTRRDEEEKKNRFAGLSTETARRQERAPNTDDLPKEIAALARLKTRRLDAMCLITVLKTPQLGGDYQIVYQAPHNSCWIEATPTMPWVLKELCLRKLRALHGAGILKRLKKLNEILITPDLEVSFHGLYTSQLLPEDENDTSEPKSLLFTPTVKRAMATEEALLKSLLKMDDSYQAGTDEFINDLKEEGKHIIRRRGYKWSRLFFVPGVGIQELWDYLEYFGQRIEEQRKDPYKVTLKRRNQDPEDGAPPSKRRTPPPSSGGENYRRRRLGRRRSGDESPRTVTSELSTASIIASVEVEDAEAAAASAGLIVTNHVQWTNAVAGPSRLSRTPSPAELEDEMTLVEDDRSSPASTSTVQVPMEEPSFPATTAASVPLPDPSSSPVGSQLSDVEDTATSPTNVGQPLINRLSSPLSSSEPNTPTLPSSSAGVIIAPPPAPSPIPQANFHRILTRAQKRKLQEEGGDASLSSPVPPPVQPPRKRRKANKQAQTSASPATSQSP